MDFGGITIAIAVMAGLGLVLSSVLALANKRLFVFEDPRIDSVEAMLPGANCGACGMPGCRAFAEAVVGGENSPSGCSVSSPEQLDAIGALLGVEVGTQEKKVARLACAGGTNVARQRVAYEGMQSCRAADLVAGGGKGCAWGCLGLGDCARVCQFDAIQLDEYHMPVVDEEKCTACGDCVEICPRDLFSIHPVSHHLWVACKNELQGEAAEAECEVACIACGRCVMDAPPSVLKLENELVIVDYQQNRRTSLNIIDRCPTGAIVWWNEKGQAVKGKAAKKIIRKSALPVG